MRSPHRRKAETRRATKRHRKSSSEHATSKSETSRILGDVPMTEAEWLAFETPLGLPYELLKQSPDRRFWLFANACCRTVWDFLNDAGREAAGLVERVASGEFGFVDGVDNSDAVFRAREVIQ